MTQWRNGGTKDTTVRRKRVIMGRESRGVLLLVALAALAAALDAFSTDSKSRISFMSAEHSSRSETASERGSEHEAGRAGGGGGGGRESLVLRGAWLVYTQPRRGCPRPWLA